MRERSVAALRGSRLGGLPAASVVLRGRSARVARSFAAVRGGTVARWAPSVALGLGILAVAGIAASFGVRIINLILDETLIKQSAVHYTHGLPSSFFHDVTARATSRLYSLTIAPFFAAAPGDVAVRMARGLNGLLFASAAIPAYLLARHVVVSRWLSVAAGLLCVAFPWLTLTTAMFSENLAYPLFLWSVLAMAAVFRRPTPIRDLLALVALGLAAFTRAQFLPLIGAYGLVIAWRLWLDRPTVGPGATVPWLRANARRFPFTLALGVAAVLVLAWEVKQGTLQDHLRRVLGTYAATTSDRKTVPSDVGISALVEVFALAIGTGVVPTLMACCWYPSALRRPPRPSVHAFAFVSLLAVGVLYATTLVAQGVYLGEATEERYFFYGAPFIWIAAFAALESRSVRPRGLLEAGAVLAAVAAVLPLPRRLDVESSYFAPAIVSIRYAIDETIQGASNAIGRTGLSERDLLAAAIVVAALGAAALWRWAPRRGLAAALGCAAVAQLGLTAIAFAAIDGRIGGVPGRTGGDFPRRGFVDRAVKDAPAEWVTNQTLTPEGTATAVQRLTLLYNDRIRRRLAVRAVGAAPDDFPLNSLPGEVVGVDAATGRLGSAPGVGAAPFAVETADSPFLQLAGERVAGMPDYRLEVLRLARPRSARWVATGLAPDGTLAAGGVARVRSWGDHDVTVRLTATTPQAARVRVSLGGERRAVVVRPGGGASATFTACGAEAGRIRASAPVLVSAVELRPGSCP